MIKPSTTFMLYSLIIIFVLVACNSTEATPTPRTRTSTATEAEDDELTIAATSTSPPVFVDILITPIISLNIPTATPACVGTPDTRLSVGGRGRVSNEDTRPLNVRSGPSTEFRILGRLEVLEHFDIVDGPECGGEYVWYLVRSLTGLEGWVAEGVGGLYFVEPYPPS